MVWPLLRAMHESCLTAGAELVITVCKIAEHREGSEQPTIAGLTGKFRT